MKCKQARQMIEQSQGVLFLFEQRVRKGFVAEKPRVIKNNRSSQIKVLSYGYRF